MDEWLPTCPHCDEQDWPPWWPYGDDGMVHAVRCRSCHWTISLWILKEQRPPPPPSMTGLEILAEIMARLSVDRRATVES